MNTKTEKPNFFGTKTKKLIQNRAKTKKLITKIAKTENPYVPLIDRLVIYTQICQSPLGMASLGCKFYLLLSMFNTRRQDDNSEIGQIYVILDRRSIYSDKPYKKPHKKDIENAVQDHRPLGYHFQGPGYSFLSYGPNPFSKLINNLY